MKKSEFKKLIKPIIQECIQEALFKNGILSNIITEVARGLSSTSIPRTIVSENKEKTKEKKQYLNDSSGFSEKLINLKNVHSETLSEIGNMGMGGVRIFEGLEPVPTPDVPINESQGPTKAKGPLADVDPNDAGVNLDGIMKVIGGKEKWNKLKGK